MLLPKALLAVALLAGCASPKVAKVNPGDVDTIPHLLAASYETISGPDGDPRQGRQWPRDRTLYLPQAIFVSNSIDDHGRVVTRIITPEEYRRTYEPGTSYETEAGHLIERFGNVAQVRSISVVRDTPDPSAPVTSRWVNYYQLYWDGRRWWIVANVWDQERPGVEIPPSWIGKFEEVSH
jgi:hypothetical protein